MEIVITTIQPPNSNAHLFSEIGNLWVIGDAKGPDRYAIGNFLSLAAQEKLPFEIVRLLPKNNYARKNIGYLMAAQHDDLVYETDDDNFPLETFDNKPKRTVEVEVARMRKSKWLNAYGLFTNTSVWPRGFPLESINTSDLACFTAAQSVKCLIQQGLANGNPDVDAVFRLTRTLPVNFERGISVALARETWCPFNSQNTVFFREAFPLMYLPSFCSFRMTDIWRSFVAQRCLWEMDSHVLFTSPTVEQFRNDHSLLHDFELEVPGYLNNAKIATILDGLSLKHSDSIEMTCENLIVCYLALIEAGIMDKAELPVVVAWVHDIRSVLT